MKNNDISVIEMINGKKTEKFRKKKIRRYSVLALILFAGLLTMNYKSWFASEADMVASADKMSTYIVAQYQKEGANADLVKICKEAKKLDETGLSLVVNTDEYGKPVVVFTKDTDPKPVIIKEIALKK